MITWIVTTITKYIIILMTIAANIYGIDTAPKIPLAR